MKKILSLICLAIILACNYLHAQEITAAEYFFDADPGVGKGTKITITTPADSVDMSDSIKLTGLAKGFHVLAIRVKNINGRWSLYESRQFYLDVPPSKTVPTITAAEYFFDADPGIGKATAIPVSAPADSIDINDSVKSTGLSAGFHVLAVRVKNSIGIWSLYESRQLYIDVPPSKTIPTITAAEYFFDADPGVGKATAIGVPAAGDSIDINDSVKTTGLKAGFHVLAVRVKNSIGIWSLYEGRQFYLDVPPSTVPPNIVAAEYFFDSDPGVGSGKAITVPTPGDSVDITSNVSTSGLSLGFHKLAVRVKNANNIWSLYESRLLYIDDSLPASTQTQIVNAETFFDTDPGNGNGTAVSPSFVSADSVDLSSDVSANGLAVGQHYLYVRVENMKGYWGLASGAPFTVCAEAPTAQFTDTIHGGSVMFTNYSTGDSTVQWNFGDGDTSTSKNVTHNYSQTGTYNVMLVVYNNCSTDTLKEQVMVTVSNGITGVTITNGANVFPNPNNGNFTLAWQLNVVSSMLQLVDVTGRIIYSQAIAGTQGTVNINLPVALSSGIYSWRIVAEDEVVGKAKMVVLK